MKVIGKGFRLDAGKFSFSNSNMVVNEWNTLSEEIIQSKSLSLFLKIDHHLGFIRGLKYRLSSVTN